MGWASEALNEASRAFVDFCATGYCSTGDSKALDIGAAFGTATMAALRAGAFVIANDLEPEHVRVLRGRVESAPDLSHAVVERLTTQVARFPRETWFIEGTLGAVHASNVFHFLTGNQLEKGMNSIAQWLRPGGKIFVHAVTPYQTAFAPFIEEYERRLAAGEKWPGWIPKLSVWSRHKKFGQMPRSIHLLDDIVLRRVAESAGLAVERVWLYRREDQPVSLCLDGRESVGLIAVKPQAHRTESEE